MAFFCCDSKRDCTTAAVIASVIIGIIAAFLRITAVITVAPVFLWVVFGIAVVYLAVLLAAATASSSPGCNGTTLTALLVGILGSILTATVLLAIPFVATSVIGAIITGALLLFFSLLITATACYVKCLVACSNR